ncbi:hypothetical protein BJ878DRAFT_433999 [Calycina marina]|uniref:Glycosyltransferase 2 n=1 Tax=Calycina marina TaxID=1763456 RepID=A0A9P7Z9T1_9HELO|nr:hypothetical protein BJ878DRAFT_433999 [Calycina marina]
MAPPRLFPSNEELSKKDDDHKPGAKGPMVWKTTQRAVTHLHIRVVKRVALGAIILVAFYLFFLNMPTDLKPPRQRPNYLHSGDTAHKGHESNPPPPSAGQDASSVKGYIDGNRIPEERTFEGPIKFYELATTLHEVAVKTSGSNVFNRNIVFAASSLSSASILLPLACEMSSQNRNYVHFALMGRDDISIDILKDVNRVTTECKIIFHDARPDLGPVSTDFRMRVSVSAGFGHVHKFIHPQATIIDSSGEEDDFFILGLKHRAGILGSTIIELPGNAEQNMLWLTMLDSASLNAWNRARIDMLVHAPTESSGSLIRLLNSLKKADLFSSAPPRLIIELPNDVDETTKRYLENFQWPPKSDSNTGSLLSIHHRIPQKVLSPEENSVRFLESFWPADSLGSHILVLSPRVELSPLFFHYLKYNILEYKFSANKYEADNLLGISLDVPAKFLDDKIPFIPPKSENSDYGKTPNLSPYLWQAPNSNAALIFGDKWVELHDFVSRTLASQHKSSASTASAKTVSKSYPSWLEHVLQLSRVRGYFTLYPSLKNLDSLATLHNELYQPPEEYKDDLYSEDPTSELMANPAKYKSLAKSEVPLATKSLLKTLPRNGVLPKISEMPMLTWDGETTDLKGLMGSATLRATIFRQEVGVCPAGAKVKDQRPGMTDDLFCQEIVA